MSVSVHILVHACPCTYMFVSVRVCVGICLVDTYQCPYMYVRMHICLCPCMSVSICVPVRKFPCPSTSLSVYVSVRLCPSLGPSLCPSMSVSLHVLMLYILYVWSYSLIHYSWVLLMNAFEPNKFTALSATLAHSRLFSLILAHQVTCTWCWWAILSYVESYLMSA